MPTRLPARLTLLAHPATADGAVRTVSVEVDQDTDGGLRLSFAVAHGGGLLVPAAQPPGPAEGLWAHTCCEAFLAIAGDSGYREFNFSPSGQWAIYDFADYRQRADSADAVPAPTIEVTTAPDLLQLRAHLPAALLPAAPPGRLLLLGLSTVSEARDGRLQYWALRHPGERPDFHDRRGFALAFAPPATTA